MLLTCKRVKAIMCSDQVFEVNPALSLQRRQILGKDMSLGFFVTFNVFVNNDLYGILTITLDSEKDSTCLLDSEHEDWIEVERDIMEYLTA